MKPPRGFLRRRPRAKVPPWNSAIGHLGCGHSRKLRPATFTSRGLTSSGPNLAGDGGAAGLAGGPPAALAVDQLVTAFGPLADVHATEDLEHPRLHELEEVFVAGVDGALLLVGDDRIDRDAATGVGDIGDVAAIGHFGRGIALLVAWVQAGAFKRRR